MLKHVRSIVAALARRFRSRAVVELENLALRHQLHVLRRQRTGRLRLITIDRLLWVWLYRLWPRCLETMVLVKPATVVQWHRQGRYAQQIAPEPAVQNAQSLSKFDRSMRLPSCSKGHNRLYGRRVN